MNVRTLPTMVAISLLGFWLGGCATSKPYDYTNFREKRPRSILVLPPINQSTDVRGTYGFLSTVTRPLAEMGYYVFPVAIVDQFLKDNGLPSAGEMHQAPLAKLAEIFGTDSVLYITLINYGTNFHILSSSARVQAIGRLVDAKSGLVLWEGQSWAEQSSNGGGGGLIGALAAAVVSQIANSATDAAHDISKDANTLLFTGHNRSNASVNGSGGPPLLYGPYHPEDPAAH
jgi:hypothetical protein